MATRMATTFAKALALELDARGVTQAALAEGVGVRQNTVSRWMSPEGFVPEPARVFEVEHWLGVEPGALSVYLGYVPPSATDWPTLATHIHGTTELGAQGRRLLLAMFRTLLDMEPKTKTKAPAA